MKLVLCHSILVSGLLLSAGCSRSGASAPVVPAGAVTASGADVANAVHARAQAESAGKRALEAPGFQWIDTPRLALAEEMGYAAAVEKIGVGEGQYDLWPAETRVWLVIFQGRWRLTPMGASQPPPQPMAYDGCLLVVLAAADGSRIAAGDAVCPRP